MWSWVEWKNFYQLFSIWPEGWSKWPINYYTKSKEKNLFVSSDPIPCFIFHIHIKTLNCEFSNKAPLDVGTSACFMDKDFAMKHCLELIGKAHPTLVEVINGWFLASGNMMGETQPLKVILGNQISNDTWSSMVWDTYSWCWLEFTKDFFKI